MSKPPLKRQTSSSPTASNSSCGSAGDEPGFKWQKGVEHVGVFFLVEGAQRFVYASAPGRYGLLLPTGTEEAWTEACHIIKARLLTGAHDLMKENRENFCWAKWEDSLTFEKTADAINSVLGPKINRQIVALGFRVDAGTETIIPSETKKKGLFGKNNPKNVLFIRITRLSLRGLNRAFARARPVKVPVSPRRIQDPRSQLYYPSPQKTSPRKSPARRRPQPPTPGLASPRGNTPIHSPRVQPKKVASPMGSTVNRVSLPQQIPLRTQPSTPRRQVPPPSSGAATNIPHVPDLNSGTEPTTPNPNNHDKLSDSQSSLQNSADLSKIVSLVADVMVDMMSEKSKTLNSSGNSLTLDGVFDTSSPKTSPKSPKKKSLKHKKNTSELPESMASLEDEVRGALLVALHSSTQKVTRQQKPPKKKPLEDKPENTTKTDVYEKRLSSLKKGARSTNGKPAKKKKRASGKTKKVPRTKAEEPPHKQDDSHLELMSESADIHFFSSDNDEGEWTDTERTLEMSFSSFGNEVDNGRSPRRDVPPRRTHAV